MTRPADIARVPARAVRAAALALMLAPAAVLAQDAGGAPVDTAPSRSPAAPDAPLAGTRNGLEIYARFRAGLADPDCPVDSSSERWRRHFARAPQRLGTRDDDSLALFGYVVDALREASLPTEYALIPFVESGYHPGARSRSGPAGLWQMAAITARDHGVPMRPGYDGRLSPVESTRAAVRYLKTLHGMFAGDWRLAVMAYNAGEYRVLGALRRAHQTANAADPSRLASLSGITRAYVRKLHALSCLLDRADEREAWLQALDRPIPWLELVELPADTRDLDGWAKREGRDAAMVRRLNPALARGAPARAHRPLRVLAPPAPGPAPTAGAEVAAEMPPDSGDTAPHVAAGTPAAAASGPAPATQAH